MNDNFSVTVDLRGQDTVPVCQHIKLNTDNVIERTEYFSVFLVRGGKRLASCQVAINDKNGGRFHSNCHTKYSVLTSMGIAL